VWCLLRLRIAWAQDSRGLAAPFGFASARFLTALGEPLGRQLARRAIPADCHASLVNPLQPGMIRQGIHNDNAP
jgi:hypothetical protein